MFISILRGDFALGMVEAASGDIWQAPGGTFIQKWKEPSLIKVGFANEEFIAADCLIMNTGADGVVLSNYAFEVLTPLLATAAQLLPVRVMGHPYWWLNCIALTDCLDLQSIDVDWCEVSGNWGSSKWISGTRRLEFQLTQLEKAPTLFRVPEFPQGMLFAKEEFRSVVKKNGLTGFVFQPVWAKTTGGIFYPLEIESSAMVDIPSEADVKLRRQSTREVLSNRRPLK